MDTIKYLLTQWANLDPAPAFIWASLVTILVINFPTCFLRAMRNQRRRAMRRNSLLQK